MRDKDHEKAYLHNNLIDFVRDILDDVNDHQKRERNDEDQYGDEELEAKAKMIFFELANYSRDITNAQSFAFKGKLRRDIWDDAGACRTQAEFNAQFEEEYKKAKAKDGIKKIK